MTYKLLTGVTGLLGRYLLRDLICRNESLAVLVRPSRFESVQQRLDETLAQWEEQWQRWLPRPVVLCGDINKSDLGLDREEMAWARANCSSVLHSAASLTFQAEGDEPYHTNVDGVRNVLAFCRDARVDVLEHVSTAYVAGNRTGLVLESELDVGQEFANDYEKSKLMAEQLIRKASHLKAYTIFRPSIIVGDYHTAFTSTYHGFYAPLRIGYALLNMIRFEEVFEVDFLSLLGLKGDENKNLVPVDWVSDAIVSIIERRPASNQTYALATSNPVTTLQLRKAFEAAVRAPRESEQTSSLPAELQPPNGSQQSHHETAAFEKAYVEQFETYRSYWRPDPVFDCANTLRALPDKPCPVLTDETLFNLCKYAIDHNFGWPRRIAPAAEFSVGDWIRNRSCYRGWDGDGLSGCSEAMRLVVTGICGGRWLWGFCGNAPWICTEDSPAATTEVRMNWQTCRSVLQGDLSPEDGMSQGKILVIGDRKLGITGLERLLRTSDSPSADAVAVF